MVYLFSGDHVLLSGSREREREISGKAHSDEFHPYKLFMVYKTVLI